MNAFYRYLSNREVRFLFCALLCRLWFDRHAKVDEEEEDSGVEVSDAYPFFVRLFEAKRWEKTVDSLFDLRWEPFPICDASMIHHVFESHWYGGWPPIERPGEGGRFYFDSLLIEKVDTARHEGELVEIVVRAWGYEPLYVHGVLEMMRWVVKNPHVNESADVPMPTPLPDLTHFWQEARDRSGQSAVGDLTDKVKRCTVCGHSIQPIDDMATLNRCRCTHCDAPYKMKKKKTSVKRHSQTTA